MWRAWHHGDIVKRFPHYLEQTGIFEICIKVQQRWRVIANRVVGKTIRMVVAPFPSIPFQHRFQQGLNVFYALGLP